jgi:transposase
VVRVDPELLFPITHRGREQQQELAAIRVRAQLVKTRTLLVNTARGLVKSLGCRLPKGSAEYFAGTTWKAVPEALRVALGPLYQALSAITAQVRELDKRVQQIANGHAETRVLTSVPGIGTLTALTYVLTLGEKTRFRTSREAGAYLGLRPRQRQSGERDPELNIAKNGDGYLRSLLVECAHHVLSRGPDSALKRWGLGLSTGKRGKRRALVAVARKLAVLLHRLWVTGESFHPFPEETVDTEGRAHRSLGAATAA